MRPRILLFEDNDILRSTLKFILNQRGYEVFTFSDPMMCPIDDSAIHYCNVDHTCADIIISDVNMPTKSGLEFIKEWRQKDCKVICIALMSGDWTDSDLESAHELGCHIFQKPFNLAEMFKWLDNCIKKIDPKRKLSDFFIN